MSVFEQQYKFCPTCKTELVRQLTDRRKLLTCPNCHFIFWNNPKPVVSAILNTPKGILMLQRASQPLKDYWCLPGGFIDFEETPQEAILREVQEEAGVISQVKNLIGVYRIDNDSRGVHIDIIYECEVPDQVTLSNEHSNYDFFKPDNLPEKVAYKHREAIEDFKNKSI